MELKGFIFGTISQIILPLLVLRACISAQFHLQTQVTWSELSDEEVDSAC